MAQRPSPNYCVSWELFFFFFEVHENQVRNTRMFLPFFYLSTDSILIIKPYQQLIELLFPLLVLANNPKVLK